MSAMSTEVAQMVARAFLSNPKTEEPAASVEEPALAPVPTQQQQAKEAAAQYAAGGQKTAEEPLRSQQQLEDDYYRGELELEDRLRAAEQMEAQGQGPTAMPANLTAPMRSENPAAITTPEQAAEQSANTAAAAHQDIETNAENDRALAQLTGETQGKIAADNQQNIDSLAGEMQLRHAHLAKVQAEVEEAQQQTINNYQQVNTEMMNMAVAQPKDIYGAAGVNSILGRIAVFLGGAGTNGFQPNANLEYIERLATHNVAQQRQRYEMLSKVGEGQRTLYGMLNAKLSNAYQIDATLKNMGLEVYKANLMAISNKYSDQTTRQAAAAEINKVNEKQAANNMGVEQQVQRDAQINLQNYSRMQANEVRAYAAQLKAHGGENGLMPLAGFVGGVPKAEHARLAKMAGGSRTLISGLNRMEKLLQEGKITGSFDDIRRFFVNDAGLLKGARDFLETGTRIEAGEQSTMQSFQVMPAEGVINIFLEMMHINKSDIAGIAGKLEEGKRVVTSATYEAVKTAAPKTATLDSRDPLFASYDPRRKNNYDVQAKFRTAAKAAERYGTDKGRALLDKAPAYTGGY